MMRERVLGVVAMSALLYVAYHASLNTTAGWSAVAAEGRHPASRARELAAKPVPDGEMIVGRPHDGVAALPVYRPR
jgi:hypothetical protein